MKYRRLGSSDMNVSALVFGAWQLGDPAYWGEGSTEKEGEAAVRGALDAGINLFDTAEMYGAGESERALGRMLGNERKNVYIASKVSPENCMPGKLRQSCEKSLERLETDVIDLYQVHWPPRDVPFEDVYGELCGLREEGKIRYIGVSNFGAGDLDAWMACGTCVSDQLGYNLLFRAIEYEVVPACEGLGVGILVYMPLLQGVLSGRWNSVEDIPRIRRRTRHFSCEREGTRHGEPGCEEMMFEVLGGIREVAEELGTSMAGLAMAWLLTKQGVTSIIVGTRNSAQLERNLEAVKLDLGEEAVRRLDALSQPIKARLGKNCDMWQGQAGSRIR